MIRKLRRMLDDEDGMATLATLVLEVCIGLNPFCIGICFPPITEPIICGLILPSAIVLDAAMSGITLLGAILLGGVGLLGGGGLLATLLAALLGCCGLTGAGGLLGGGGLLATLLK